MNAPRLFLVGGCLLAFLAVALGAFAAHGLRDLLTPERLAVFQTGVQYQFYHALALLLTGLLGERATDVRNRAAGYLFLTGIALFSGSLYLLTLLDLPLLGMVTPLGGAAFLAGWIALALHAASRPATP